MDAIMKSAEIFSVPLTINPGFGWRWRAGNYESPEWFVFYRDCARDAQRHGYELVRAQPEPEYHAKTEVAKRAKIRAAARTDISSLQTPGAPSRQHDQTRTERT